MKKNAPYKCLECGKLFYSVKSAQKASDKGCPGCGGVDVDVNVEGISHAVDLVLKAHSEGK